MLGDVDEYRTFLVNTQGKELLEFAMNRLAA